MKTSFVILLAIYLAIFVGWVLNIYALLTTTGPIAAWTAMEIARVVGIFIVPVGAVLGYV